MKFFGPVPRLAALGVLAVVALLIVFAGYFTVQPYERTVVTRFGRLVYVADPGFHFKLPIADATRAFRIDIQDVHPNKGVNTYTIDNQEVDVLFNVYYRIPVDKVGYVYQTLPDFEQRLYIMAIDRLKVELGKVNITSLAERRGELREAVKKVLTTDATGLGLEVTDFQLTDLQYDEGFRNAVKNAAVQKANIESRSYERQQAEQVAQTAKIRAIGEADAAREAARGAADARILQATAEARAIQLQGEAQAAAIGAQAAALKANPDLVNLRRAERWDGRLPTNVYGAAPIPFLDVK
jgi:regulator of protease activity HflC (stomatin/prohibitin superfamily)